MNLLCRPSGAGAQKQRYLCRRKPRLLARQSYPQSCNIGLYGLRPWVALGRLASGSGSVPGIFYGLRCRAVYRSRERISSTPAERAAGIGVRWVYLEPVVKAIMATLERSDPRIHNSGLSARRRAGMVVSSGDASRERGGLDTFTCVYRNAVCHSHSGRNSYCTDSDDFWSWGRTERGSSHSFTSLESPLAADALQGDPSESTCNDVAFGIFGEYFNRRSRKLAWILVQAAILVVLLITDFKFQLT